MHGICHVDFSAKDAAHAEFYKTIFGWELIPMMSEYILWKNGEENLGGGFSLQCEGRPWEPGTLVYIEVEDIEATLGKITASGGTTLMPKMEIPGGHGFLAIFTDPSGTKTGLWSKPLPA